MLACKHKSVSEFIREGGGTFNVSVPSGMTPSLIK